MKASKWAFDRIEEAFDLVALDEAEKKSIVQEIMLRSTDYLRRIIAPVGGQGGVSMSYLCPHCNSFLLEDYVWWVSGRKSTKEKHDWKQLNWLLVVQTGDSFEQAKGLQSACGTSRPVRIIDQCVEIASEPARRWR